MTHRQQGVGGGRTDRWREHLGPFGGGWRGNTTRDTTRRSLDVGFRDRAAWSSARDVGEIDTHRFGDLARER
jgi:hypothetical protein